MSMLESARSEATDETLVVMHEIAAPITTVWQTLISPEGVRTWLGEGATLGSKGDAYHCTDGTSGVVRSFHPLEQLRVSWHATPDSPPSLIELALCEAEGATQVTLRHHRLAHPHLRADLHQRWSNALTSLATLAVP